jgi:acetylornithine/N-succinyldiaminopimelate aminotransferase
MGDNGDFPIKPVTAMSADTADLLSKSSYYLPVYAPRQLVLERGQGARVWDVEGREFIDLAAGIAVCSLGHNDADLKAALLAQADKLWHTSNVFYTEPALRLAEELVTASKFAERVFFCNSGAEANEVAIKLIRKWASNAGRDASKRTIVTCRGSFHGRTLATVTATAQPKYQAGYEPLPGGFRYIDFNDVAQLEEAMAGGDVAAVLFEPVQGEGGVVPASAAFMARARELCDAHDALLVFDEIQVGMGRSGKLFAHWNWNVTPDIVTLAKALGCGFPIGAMLAGPKVATAMGVGSHGTTFGGNPLATAVARVALAKLSSEAIEANVARQAAALRAGLQAINDEFQLFDDIRGMGLMLGAELKPEYVADIGALQNLAAEHQVLILQAGINVLRFVPALSITDEEVAEGLKRLHAAIAAYVAAR